jgi:DDE superfamily endonuclease
MRTLPARMLHLLNPFMPLFSKRIWSYVQLLLAGAFPQPRANEPLVPHCASWVWAKLNSFSAIIGSLGPRRLVGSGGESCAVLGLVVMTFVPSSGPLVIGVDETLERRWGKKIAAKGVYRDLRCAQPRSASSKRVALKVGVLDAFGAHTLGGTCVGVTVFEHPRSIRALHCPARQAAQEDNRVGTSSASLGEALVARALLVVAVADSAYASLRLLASCQRFLPRPVTFITRLRLDAALYDPAPPRKSLGRDRETSAEG